jgi:hypothetical protein
VVWSVILCSRSARRESQTDLRAAGRRAGGRGLAWSGEGRGLEMERAGGHAGRRIRSECVTLWKERQAAGEELRSERHGGKGSLQPGDRRLCGARWHRTGG